MRCGSTCAFRRPAPFESTSHCASMTARLSRCSERNCFYERPTAAIDQRQPAIRTGRPGVCPAGLLPRNLQQPGRPDLHTRVVLAFIALSSRQGGHAGGSIAYKNAVDYLTGLETNGTGAVPGKACSGFAMCRCPPSSPMASDASSWCCSRSCGEADLPVVTQNAVPRQHSPSATFTPFAPVLSLRFHLERRTAV